MEKRLTLMNDYYSRFNEEERLIHSRQGQLEYAVTMEYIHRYLKKESRILEIGAGTGQYSIALAKEGYEVNAVELVAHNLEILKENSKGLENISSFQGDALNLSMFASDSFDVTLVFGPMYHLYDTTDVHKAIDEALRVTKKNGVILFAFLSVYGIMYSNYLCNNFCAGLKENYTEDYQVLHFLEQGFTGYDIQEFESLFDNKNTEYITTLSVDSILELIEQRNDFHMSDEDFDAFVKYHLAHCEKRELLGASNHLLYLCKKQ